MTRHGLTFAASVTRRCWCSTDAGFYGEHSVFEIDDEKEEAPIGFAECGDSVIVKFRGGCEQPYMDGWGGGGTQLDGVVVGIFEV